MRCLLVTIKHFTLLVGSSQGEAKRLSLLPSTPGPSRLCSFAQCFPCLACPAVTVVGCRLLGYSPGSSHPRLSSCLTCVKRLSFESVGKLFFCPIYPVQAVCRCLCSLLHTVAVTRWLLCVSVKPRQFESREGSNSESIGIISYSLQFMADYLTGLRFLISRWDLA